MTTISSYLRLVSEDTVAEHHGVIDGHPSRSKHVRLGFNQSLVSDSPDVHRGDPIVVRPVAAVRARVQVLVLASVRFPDHAATGARLGRVRGVDQHDRVARTAGLVLDHLPELEERPADLHVALAPVDLDGGLPYALEVFEHDQGRGLAVGDECLGDLMVHVPHPTVFSVADMLKPASGAARAFLLKVGAQRLVVGASVCHLLPAVESCSAVAVIRGREEPHAQIDTHYVPWPFRFGKPDGGGYEQQPFATVPQQASGAEPAMSAFVWHARPVNVDFDASVERVHAQPSVLEDRVVTVPHEVVPGARVFQRTFRLPWRSLVLLDGPVVAYHADDGRLGHLRAHMVCVSQMTVGELVEFLLGEGAVRFGDAAHMVAACEVRIAGAFQQFGFGGGWCQPHRMGQGLHWHRPPP